MSELGNRIDSPSGFEVTVGALRPRAGRCLGLLMFLVALLSCSAGGGDVADNGGMSGTGISQGSISAFGSIFVNGVEWDVSGATIEIDGVPALESDLRVGMVVRVDGDFAAAGLTGTATSVRFDDAVEGPIEATPVETIPGSRKTFSVLGTNIEVDVVRTLFGGGASYANLAADDVVEVSGFADELGVIQATRVEAKGAFPGNSSVELRGVVSNLVKQSDGSGIFDLGPIVVRYLATTSFDDVTRDSLAADDLVEVRGLLRLSGTEVDATELELEVEGLGGGDSPRVEIEGFVVDLLPVARFLRGCRAGRRVLGDLRSGLVRPHAGRCRRGGGRPGGRDPARESHRVGERRPERPERAHPGGGHERGRGRSHARHPGRDRVGRW